MIRSGSCDRSGKKILENKIQFYYRQYQYLNELFTWSSNREIARAQKREFFPNLLPEIDNRSFYG